MKGVIAILDIFVAVIVFLAGPVSIIWLGFRGDWWAIGYAAIALFSPPLLSIVLTPGMLLALAASNLNWRRPYLKIILIICHHVFVALVVTAWCMGSFMFFLAKADTEATLPVTLLAFAVGTLPFIYMASFDSSARGGSASATNAFFMNLAFVVAAVYHICLDPDSWLVTWIVFGGVLMVGNATVLIPECIAFVRSVPGGRQSTLPVEVRECIKEMGVVLSEFRTKSSFSDLDEVERRVAAHLYEVDRTVHSVREGRVSPRNLVLVLVTNVAGEFLRTGRFHLYRGHLSLAGESLRGVFLSAVEELEQNGYHSIEDSAKDRKWLANAISEAG